MCEHNGEPSGAPLKNTGGSRRKRAEEVPLVLASGRPFPWILGRPQELSGEGRQREHGGCDGTHLRPPKSCAHHREGFGKDEEERPSPMSFKHTLKTTRLVSPGF